MAEYYSVVYIYIHTYVCHIFLTKLSVAGQLGCFHVLAIVSSAALNIGVHVSLQIRVFIFFLAVYPGVGLLDHMVVLCLVFCVSVFLSLPLWHMEVPRLGVKSEL